MKKIILLGLIIYKGPISLFMHSVLGLRPTCRFVPSCSEYMMQEVKKHGTLTGIKCGLRQFGKCHPLGGNYGTNI